MSGGKVVFLDGYAGPGRYESGEAASPMLAIELAKNISTFRNLRCVFVELDKDYFAQLNSLIQQEAGDLDVQARQGRIEDHISEIVSTCGDAPLFAYLDPFGVGVPFNTLTETLLGRSKYGHPKTEVLLNFSIQAFDRVGGLIKSTARNRAATLARMDQTLGGDWWQRTYLENSGVDRLNTVVRGYRERISAATTGWGGWTVPVFDKIGGRPEYLLLHFTQHPDGHWEFHQALSSATREWREAAHAAHPPHQDRLAEMGQLPLEGLEEPTPFEEDENAWVDEIERSVLLLRTGERVVVQDRMSDIFGRSIGLARELHLRKALNRLYDAGRIENPPIGKLQRYVIVLVKTPPPQELT